MRLAYFFIALYRNSSSTDKFLAKSSPTSLKPLIVLVGDDIYSVFGQLKNGVKQGTKSLTIYSTQKKNDLSTEIKQKVCHFCE